MSVLILFPKGLFNTATEMNLYISNKETEPVTFKLPTTSSSGNFFHGECKYHTQGASESTSLQNRRSGEL